ncbi:MAG TPA: T9SS type A sorting domain-containing protein [Puia sp.]|nr:T9SS type A sorting domain-containing protein [Puia sp.]
MKRCLWLISLVLCCCVTVRSQQTGEATGSSDDSSKLLTTRSNVAVFTNFTGSVREGGKVWLQWDVDSAEDGDYFVVQRSTDGVTFETIGALRKTGNNSHYELTDMAPPNGTDLYRIKYTGQDGKFLYSKQVQLSLSGDVEFKFYPNPVDKLLIIRTEHTIDIQIVDAIGSIRLSRRLQPGIQVINASSLERGNYVLRVADKESNRIVSNQLLKN